MLTGLTVVMVSGESVYPNCPHYRSWQDLLCLLHVGLIKSNTIKEDAQFRNPPMDPIAAIFVVRRGSCFPRVSLVPINCARNYVYELELKDI